MADEATHMVNQKLIDAVNTYTALCRLELPNDQMRDAIESQFSELHPAANPSSLADIINAGWRMRLKDDMWPGAKIKSQAKLPILNDLIFKSIDVLEYELRKAGA